MSDIAGRSPQRIGWKAGLLVLSVGLILGLVAVLILGRDSNSGGISKGTKSTQTGTGAAGQLTSENVTWRDFGGLQLPTAAAGPKHVENGRAWGFDHSPAGAVLAAVHMFSRAGALFGPAVFEPTIQEQVVGVDKEQFVATVRAEYAQSKAAGRVGPNGELISELERGRRDRSGVWAYRIDGYDPSITPVHLLLRTAPAGDGIPVFVDLAFTLKWIDGDWRLVAPLDGSWSSVSRQVPDVPAGYVVIAQS